MHGMVCLYHDDLDGRCAAAIVRCALGKGLYLPVCHHRPVLPPPASPGETLVILDYSPGPDILRSLRGRYARLIWIDHHASALGSPGTEDIEGLREIGRAACELTWRFFCPDRPEIPRAVLLAADRDLWQWRYGEETAAFCEGIRAVPHAPEDTVWRDVLEDRRAALDALLRDGAVCRRYQRALAAEFIEQFGFETELAGHRCYAANCKSFGSDVFGERFDRYPFCAAFVFDGARYSVSLYSRDTDVLAIAMRFGGGGHRNAAGFLCDRLPFTVGDTADGPAGSL